MANNKEMKTLGGYEIVDEKAREDINIVAEKANEALSLAKGATKAFVYDTYSDMISELNQLDKAKLLVNYHIMIREVCVPDLWISGISDEYVEYTYTSNEDFITDLTEDGVVQVGHFVLSALETQKVDLSEYVKNTDYATSDGTKSGIVKLKVYGSGGLDIDSTGCLILMGANQSLIDTKNGNRAITPSNLDYAVMKALSDSKLKWTDEQKQAVIDFLGVVKNTLPTEIKEGVAKVNTNYGVYIDSGYYSVVGANKQNINDKNHRYRPITPSVLDYAVKKALSDCKLTGDDVWTEEEKTSAREQIGAIGSNNAASKDNLGVIKAFSTGDKNVPGVGLSGNNILGIVRASNTDIDEQTNTSKPIVPSNLSYAIKVGLIDNNIEWTDEEKAKALELLGGVDKKYVDDLVGSVEYILTELRAYAETKIGGDTQ